MKKKKREPRYTLNQIAEAWDRTSLAYVIHPRVLVQRLRGVLKKKNRPVASRACRVEKK